MRKKRVIVFITCLVLFLSFISGVKMPVNVKAANNSSDYITRDDFYDLNDKNVNREESEHFQIIWGNKDNTITEELVKGNLTNLETIRSFYIDKLGMDDPAYSMTNAVKGKYKTNLYIANTGLSQITDDWAYMSVDSKGFAFMVLDKGALRVDPPSWVVPHEYAHVVTYHQGGVTPNGWYESIANWFRDQYLGSSYYRYGNNVYGPDADFFGPLVFNSNIYFPHYKNWYDNWPILLYITENPDNIKGLGLGAIRNILHDKTSDNMFTKIENATGVSIKDILGGYSKRMVTYDYSRQSSYKVRFKELIDSGNYKESDLYTTMEASSDGYLKVPDSKVPMEGGYNIIPLNIEPDSKSVSVDFKGSTEIKGADFRVTIVSVTNTGETRYSTTWNKGTNSMKLLNDEDKVYLVVCATPDKMEDLDLFGDEKSAPKYYYEIKVNSNKENIKGDVNGDGKISLVDYVKLQKYILDNNSSIIDIDAGDINNDGIINVKDLYLLKSKLNN